MRPEAMIEKDASLLGGGGFEIGDIVWVTCGVGTTANRFRDPVIQGICQKGVGIEQIGACDASAAISARGAFQGSGVVWLGAGAPPSVTLANGEVYSPNIGNYIGILSDEHPQVANGCLPDAILVPVDTNYTKTSLGPVVVIDAVDSWNNLAKAFKEHFGHRIKAGQFYRTFSGGDYSQVGVKERHVAAGTPWMAADPGSSNHGWGLAVDIDLTDLPETWSGYTDSAGNFATEQSDEEKYESAAYVWLAQNAPQYGWHNPNWAKAPVGWPEVRRRPRNETGPGRTPEPWHWEYINANAVINPR